MLPLVQGYDELRLRFERTHAGGYDVQASAGEAEAFSYFQLPFSALELENFILRVSRPRGRRRISASALDDARRIGAGLFTALFGEDLESLYRATLARARSAERGVRITLCLSASPDLIDVPWEYLFDEPDFLSMSAFTPVVRYLDLPRAHRPLLVRPPLRVLGIVSNPADHEQLDVEREQANLTRALSGMIEAGAVELQWLERATLGALLRTLQRNEFHALHYIGHGTFDHQAGRGVLLFEDEAGWARPVSGDKLGMVLHDFSSLRLAVLNACEGARTSREDPFAGVAGALLQRDIPAVVAMQFEISDEAALVFADGFYTTLAAGLPVDASLAAARLAMLAERADDIEWGTPVLFMRVPDGRIFDLTPEPAADRTGIAEAEAVAVHPHRGRRRALAAGVIAALAAAGAGVGLLGAGGSAAAPRTVTASAPPFVLVYQRPWRSAIDPVTGASLLNRAPPAGARAQPGIAELASGRATLAAGSLKLSDPVPGGAPPGLVARYGRPSSSAAAQVAGHAGRTYRWSATRTGVVVAYVLPMRAGDAAIICTAPGTDAALSSCQALASSARAVSAQPVPPGADRRLSRAVADALNPVSASRSRVALARGTLTSRVAALTAVAQAEARAVISLRGVAAPLRYRRPLADETAMLAAEATSFATLAQAARTGDRTGYARDLGELTSAGRDLRRAARALARYGLAAPPLAQLHLAGPPAPAANQPQQPSSSTTTSTSSTPPPTSNPTPTPPAQTATTTTPFS